MLDGSRRASARLVAFAAIIAACQGAGTTTTGSANPLAQRIDSIAAARLATGLAAGFSIGVMKGNDTVVMKGYGSADLELEVPTPSGGVYEIGSVTKQFTAAAIMQLRDSGKLSLDDDLSTHLPDYPMQGQKVSIRRLLDHTSGIKGYTEMPVFGQIVVHDLPKDTLVKLFGREKFEFAPGALEVYNNSAYFLAGLIIEKLSGMSYADYVKKHFFEKVGMSSSDYCSESRVMKKKVKGYDYGRDSTLHHKGFLVHTWPYAAGSLCSTARDLVAWNRALHNGQVLSPASYTDMITPGALSDGTKLRYGTGLALRTVGGHRLIEHGGGINGFVSASHYYPDDSLTVVVLINTAGPMAADRLAVDVAMSILGREPAKTETFSGDLNALAGAYTGVARGERIRATVTAGEGKLLLLVGPEKGPARPGATTDTLTYLGGGTWANDEAHYVFTMPGATPTELRIDNTYGYSILKRAP